MTLLKEFVLVEVKHMVVDMKLKSKRAEKYSVFLFGLLISILLLNLPIIFAQNLEVYK